MDKKIQKGTKSGFLDPLGEFEMIFIITYKLYTTEPFNVTS